VALAFGKMRELFSFFSYCHSIKFSDSNAKSRLDNRIKEEKFAMESRADYVAAKVAENLSYEALLAIIGAVSPSPNQTAKACLELGIAPEGEKVAKWVAVLKREFPSSRDFLGTLKRIYDQKTEAEMAAKSLEEVSQETDVKIIDKIAESFKEMRLKVRHDKILDRRIVNESQIRNDLEDNFVSPWMRRLTERLKRVKVCGQGGIIIEKKRYADTGYEFHYASGKDCLPQIVKGYAGDIVVSFSQEGKNLLTVELRFELKVADIKKAYAQTPFSVANIGISLIEKAGNRLVRQARALAKWMAKNNMAEVIEIGRRS